MKKISHLQFYFIGLILHYSNTLNASQLGIYNKIFLGGKTPECVTTQFNLTERLFNEKPVYKSAHTLCNNPHTYIYYHNNHWGLAYKAPEEVNSSVFTQGIASQWPWDAVWPNGIQITPIRTIQVVGTIIFEQCSRGNYFFSSEVVNDKPLYISLESPCFGKEWYLYSDTEGYWSLGYNHPRSSNHYRTSRGIKSTWPWDKAWPEGVAVAIKYFHD